MLFFIRGFVYGPLAVILPFHLEWLDFLLLLFDNNNNKRNTYCRLTKLPFDNVVVVVVSLFCGVCDVVDLVDFV